MMFLARQAFSHPAWRSATARRRKSPIASVQEVRERTSLLSVSTLVQTFVNRAGFQFKLKH